MIPGGMQLAVHAAYDRFMPSIVLLNTLLTGRAATTAVTVRLFSRSGRGATRHTTPDRLRRVGHFRRIKP